MSPYHVSPYHVSPYHVSPYHVSPYHVSPYHVRLGYASCGPVCRSRLPPVKPSPPGILLYGRFPPGKSTMRRILPPPPPGNILQVISIVDFWKDFWSCFAGCVIRIAYIKLDVLCLLQNPQVSVCRKTRLFRHWERAKLLLNIDRCQKFLFSRSSQRSLLLPALPQPISLTSGLAGTVFLLVAIRCIPCAIFAWRGQARSN